MNAIAIGQREIGTEFPCYVIAELSANHNQQLEQALRLVDAAADAGADAIKLQTYRADTITLDAAGECFEIQGDSIWAGRRLYDLYCEAHTPWEWHAPLQQRAKDRGLDFFSSPFDLTAIDFLEDLQVPAYKIASFEIVDLGLIRRAAETGKPLIMSTGMASLAEIDDAVRTARETGNEQLVLLKCTSSYPARPEDMNLRTLPHLAQAFGTPVGLSDHTLGTAVPVAAVALGARVVEKHLTLSRQIEGPDSKFSLEPHEFADMVQAVRFAQAALGQVRYRPTSGEQGSAAHRRSLFAVADIAAGEAITTENVRSIRPGAGLPPRLLPVVLGKRAVCPISRGTPLQWHHLMNE